MKQLKQKLAALLLRMAAGCRRDQSRVGVTVRSWRLTKWQGDPPKPGEYKVPLEIIEWNDSNSAVSTRYPQNELKNGG
ncbi:MAG: hypothetical protein GXP10_07870 [Gammaproteobacteria bacterium]|nr:hypothetical protein [Gammaproteobacteria bacterium]